MDDRWMGWEPEQFLDLHSPSLHRRLSERHAHRRCIGYIVRLGSTGRSAAKVTGRHHRPRDQ